MYRHRLACLVIVLLLVTGCGDDPIEPSSLVQGRYNLMFESSALDPCDIDQSWWVVNSDVLRDQYDAIAEFPGQEVFLSVAGRMSAVGSYGHMGAYEREFRITEVNEIRPLEAGDCP